MEERMPGTPLAKTTRQATVAKAIRQGPVNKESPAPMAQVVRHLEAGEWQCAHTLVQKDATVLGCWAHGIVHLVEGDLENAKYWYRRAHRPLPHGNTAAAEIAALKAMVRQGTQ
jgi:hypothetical protein